MWRRMSHALAWFFFRRSDVSLCAEMARRHAACRYCRCVCRVLEFIPGFGPGHCDDELEFYAMTDTGKPEPGPQTEDDINWWRAWQEIYGLKADGDVGHQTTWQVQQNEIQLQVESEFARRMEDEVKRLKSQITVKDDDNWQLIVGLAACTGIIFGFAIAWMWN